MSYPFPFFFLFAFGVVASSCTHISRRRSSPLIPRFFKYFMIVFPVFCNSKSHDERSFEMLTFQLDKAPFRWQARVLSLLLITITPRSVGPS